MTDYKKLLDDAKTASSNSDGSVTGEYRAYDAHSKALSAAPTSEEKDYHRHQMKRHFKKANTHEGKSMKSLKTLQEWDAQAMIKKAADDAEAKRKKTDVKVDGAVTKHSAKDKENTSQNGGTYSTDALDSLNVRMARTAIGKMRSRSKSRIIKNLKDSVEVQIDGEQLEEVRIPPHIVQMAASRLGLDVQNSEHHAQIASSLEKHHGVVGVVKPKEPSGVFVARGGNPTV